MTQKIQPGTSTATLPQLTKLNMVIAKLIHGDLSDPEDMAQVLMLVFIHMQDLDRELTKQRALVNEFTYIDADGIRRPLVRPSKLK